MLRVPYEDLFTELNSVLLELGFEQKRADLCARLFAEASRDGVYSHGLNRFPRFITSIRRGIVDIHATPLHIGSFGVLERWDGRLGPGNLNAQFCMARAISLARKHGVGCIALQNTNHWMRGGSYGWQAADAGAIGMCWTNTMPNLPPWGARESRIGNNPLIIAVPRPSGHVVLDIAMSQFSLGSLEHHRLQGLPLPIAGGYDEDGQLTDNPGEIESTGRLLPIGYWKGSGLSLALDMMAALLSGGHATHQISTDPIEEAGLSQVFLTFDLLALSAPEETSRVVESILYFIHSAAPAREGDAVYYPGEKTLLTRKENMELGVPVDPLIWRQVQGLSLLND